jgi:hypothetical protein
MNHALDMKTLAELALLGGKFDWKNTPIEITQAARATDPLNLARDCWWHQAEPRDAAGGKIIVIVDDVGKENMEARSGRPVTSAQIAAAQEDSENDSADQLLPDDTESISTWFARIAKSIDFSGDKIALWDGLRA